MDISNVTEDDEILEKFELTGFDDGLAVVNNDANRFPSRLFAASLTGISGRVCSSVTNRVMSS